MRIIYWYHPPNDWEFSAFGEKLNLEIKQTFEAAGIRFALPSSTMYLADRSKVLLQNDSNREA